MNELWDPIKDYLHEERDHYSEEYSEEHEEEFPDKWDCWGGFDETDIPLDYMKDHIWRHVRYMNAFLD